MIVYFTCSGTANDKDMAIRDAIVKIVRDEGHVLAKDWHELTLYEKLQGRLHRQDWEALCDEIILSLKRADAVIVDATNKANFRVGYETALALQYKKPVLLLKKLGVENDIIQEGLNDTLLTHKNIDYITVQKIVAEFLRGHTIKSKDLRFNLVIDRQIHNYLRWRSSQTGKTKAEIVRDLLEQDILEDQ